MSVTPETVSAAVTRAIMLKEAGNSQEAEGMLQQAWRRGGDELGKSHPAVLSAMSNLGALYQSMGRLEDAAPFCTGVVALRREDRDAAGGGRMLLPLLTPRDRARRGAAQRV